MYEAARDFAWDHTAHISWIIAVSNGAKGVKINTFHPFKNARGEASPFRPTDFERVRREANLPKTLPEEEIERKWQEWLTREQSGRDQHTSKSAATGDR